MRALAGLLVALLASTASAQTTDTDIYVAPLRMVDGWVAVGALKNLTNRVGYDNQPHFTADGRAILYTAQIDNQTDIYRYDLRNNRLTRVTNTPESEYSPTPTLDGGITVIRVEPDSTQRLWRFNTDGTNPRLLLPEIRPVGYHAWINPQQVAVYVLGQPSTLRIASVRGEPVATVAENIGRSVQRIPRWAGVSFVHRQPDTTMWVKRVNGSSTVAPIAKLPEGGEYHAWTPRAALLATTGSRLLEWTPIDGGTWRTVADFSAQGLRVSRIAVSPRGDWIAIVGERPR